MSEFNRREFVTGALAVAAVACACLSCPVSEALAAPGDKRGPGGNARGGAPGATGGKIDIGALTDYSKDGISDKFIKSNKLAIIRADGKIYATSAVCTHKFAVLTVAGDQFKCVKHGSEFSNHGTVIKGPAGASLVRYEIKKNDAGHLIVNTANSFREKDWETPDAFVAIA